MNQLNINFFSIHNGGGFDITVIGKLAPYNTWISTNITSMKQKTISYFHIINKDDYYKKAIPIFTKN